MKKEVDIIKLSEFVIAYFNELGESITNLKLQKLMYYIQAWHLANFDHSFFNEEPEAWVNGPVYKSLYEKYRENGGSELVTKLEEGKSFESVQAELLQNLDIDEEQKELLSTVLQKYGMLPTMQLVYLTNAEDPWNAAREGLSAFEISDAKISHKSMKQYYKSILERRKN